MFHANAHPRFKGQKLEMSMGGVLVQEVFHLKAEVLFLVVPCF